MTVRTFAQVDVFGRGSVSGNPVAVVIDGDGLSDAEMLSFTRWTNLSEATFLLPPSAEAVRAGADYRARIWTAAGELPFAGHPTLGSAHAWLAAGGIPRTDGTVVQECGIGCVALRLGSGSGAEGSGASTPTLSFAAPELLRSGPGDERLLQQAATCLGIDPGDILSSAWTDNGPGWFTVEVGSIEQLLALSPDFGELGNYDELGNPDTLETLSLGVFARYGENDERLYEVRAFVSDGNGGGFEDPVTGSLNAGIARWLIEAGRVSGSYRAGQGHALGRDGLITVESEGDTIWVGGQTVTVIEGSVQL